MPLQSPVLFSGFATNMVTNPDHHARIPYSHADIPKHVEDLGKIPENPQQAPKPRNGEKAVSMQQVIFDRKYIDLLNEAAQDPNHRLRPAAEQAMQGFTVAAKKAEITTLNKAEKEYGIPNETLWGWVAKGVIPFESRDKNAVYVRRDILDKVAPVYHQAKEQGKLAAPILKRMHDELFPAHSTSPRTD